MRLKTHLLIGALGDFTNNACTLCKSDVSCLPRGSTHQIFGTSRGWTNKTESPSSTQPVVVSPSPNCLLCEAKADFAILNIWGSCKKRSIQLEVCPWPLSSSTVPHLTRCPPVVFLSRIPGRLRFLVLSILAFLEHTRDFAKVLKLGAPAYTIETRTSESAAQAKTELHGWI